MSFLREETRKAGFYTLDGVHMGPCEIHRRHAYTIGPDGSLYACPGFTGEAAESTGHIDGLDDEWRRAAAERFDATERSQRRMRRLLLHSRVWRRLFDGGTHGAWRHALAVLSQGRDGGRRSSAWRSGRLRHFPNRPDGPLTEAE